MTGIGARTATGAAFDTATSTYTTSKPTGLAVDDCLLIGVCYLGTTATFTPPSGFSQVGSTDTTTTTMRSAVWKIKATSTEVAASTFSVALGAGFRGFIVAQAFSGVDTTTEIDAEASGGVTPAAASATLGLTTVTSDAWLWHMTMSRHAFGSKTLANSDGSDVSEYAHSSLAVSGFDYTAGVWDSGRDLSTGAQSRTITVSSSTDQFTWQAVALRPAGSGTPGGRLYRSALVLPQAAPPKRGKLYRLGLSLPAHAGGKGGRLYRMGLVLPSPTPAVTSGRYVFGADGGVSPVAMYSDVAGQI
jgi:hypothetical protein